ncbi:MAG: hypothetical protein PHV43_02330 [Candidatus Colwellbacteria bacterium]|nr:hypothetical protein [Candidatus Colwellbacteria bacterium]
MKMNYFRLPDLLRDSHSGRMKWRAMFVGALAVVLAGVLLYFNLPSKGIGLEINPPEGTVSIGIPFELEVRLLNNSQSDLDDTRITLGLPKGLALFEDSQKVNVIKGLGEIAPGGVAKAVFTVIALPSEGEDDYVVSASATYMLGSLSAEFTKKVEKKLSIGARDVDFELSIPDTIAVGQEFQINVRYRNLIDEIHKNKEFPSIALTFGESQDFSVVNSDPMAIDQKWILEEGEDKQISILGRVSNKNEDVFVLKGKVILEFGGKEYPLREKEAEVFLAPSPLSFDLYLDDAGGTVLPGDLLTYNIRYWNNTDADLKDVIIRAQLMGTMFDFETLRTDGSFNGLSQTISWTSSKFNKLAELKRGDEGTLSFSIRTKANFSTEGTNSNILKAKGTIESPTLTQGSAADRTSGSDTEETKIAGAVRVNARAYFRDADEGVLNQGPFPPRVGQMTNYSVHIEVAGYGNSLEEVRVKTRLENNVSLVDFVEGGAGPAPEYNESTREIIWTPGAIAVSNGASTGKLEMVFQIEATPDASLIGQYMPLLDITTASARDVFADVDLAATDEALSTLLPDDKSIGSGEGKVIY